MGRFGGILLASLATAAPGLECRGKDSAGVTSCWSESSSETLRSFPINLVDLPNAVIGGITFRMRNNSVLHYRVTLNPGDLSRSWLGLQVSATAFNPRTTQSIGDLECQKAVVRKRAPSAEFREITRIRDLSRTGWLAGYRAAAGRRWCYAAVLAFEPSHWGAGTSDELYTMVLHINDCTGRRTREQLEAWLHSLRSVPEGYNRK